MKEITYLEAIKEALVEEMERDENVFILGEDVAILGGPFGVTKGLIDKFGKERVRETPISEAAFVGCGVGAASTGMRPVVEVMYSDFLMVCMDQIVNQAAKMKYMFGGEVKIPLTIRTMTGAGLRAAAHHSQSIEALFIHIPGLKVVNPSTPADAKGLLKSSIRDENPVLFFEHKMLYRTKGLVPEGEYLIPLGKADIKRTGKDVTVVAVSGMVRKVLTASKTLAEEGIDIEVIDPRTIAPLDIETIINSVKKTGRLVTVAEGCKTGGIGSEIAAQVAEGAFNYLCAPIKRIAALDAPIPFNPKLEDYVIPDEKDITKTIRLIMKKTT